MTLRRKGEHWYGDDLADLREEVLRYSLGTGYRIARDYAPACACGGGVMTKAFGSGTFFMGVDDEDDGVALICDGTKWEDRLRPRAKKKKKTKRA